MNDIVSTMFNRRFIDEIFSKHQPIYSRRVLKTMFDKLAHASIMKLNSNSMDKLYDLMTMAVKYQVLMCHNPRHIIALTLNHLDAILGYVTDTNVNNNVEAAFNHLVTNYAPMTVGEIQAVRYSILNFFQDIHVRISAFLQDNVQHNTGRFVMYPPLDVYTDTGLETPGTIRFMDQFGEVVETTKFHPGQTYKSETEMLGLEIGAKRSTILGQNIYAGRSSVESSSEDVTNKHPSVSNIVTNKSQISTLQTHFPCKDDASGELAKEELNLLAKLIGTKTDMKTKDTFRLNMFDMEADEEHDHIAGNVTDQVVDTTVNIHINSTRARKDLEKIISEMTVDQEENEEEDLLALMDKAQ